ncbi:MAG TPA: hypothetical protein ENJ38_11640 [Rhodospirillales bacterium]|nr:hypothetical protein [Rhodospirillales bacterium]
MPARPTHTFTYSVVTPLFLGDALRDATRFSLASFKGQLRFWWRALVWSEIGDLARLQQAEARLFGKAGESGKEALGQSRVLIRIEALALGKGHPEGHRLGPGPGARYLGYGLMHAFGSKKSGTQPGELTRSCFPAGGWFRVGLLFREDVDDDERNRVLDALKLLGLLGGLGARVRRGWGSLTLEKLEGPDADWRKPESIEAYKKAVRDIVGRPQVGRPPFSAFSAESRVDLLATGTEFLALLDRVGREMARYRAWGFNGKLPDGEPALQLFREDHDWAKQPWTGERNGYLPRRAAFGLPHNYGPNCHNAGVTTTGTDGAGDRRGSPLFLHIQDLGRGGFAAVATFLPAAFTPDGKAKAKWDRGGYVAPVPTNWRDTITGWLEGDYPRNGRTVKFFPDREPLLP